MEQYIYLYQYSYCFIDINFQFFGKQAGQLINDMHLPYLFCILSSHQWNQKMKA